MQWPVGSSIRYVQEERIFLAGLGMFADIGYTGIADSIGQIKIFRGTIGTIIAVYSGFEIICATGNNPKITIKTPLYRPVIYNFSFYFTFIGQMPFSTHIGTVSGRTEYFGNGHAIVIEITCI